MLNLNSAPGIERLAVGHLHPNPRQPRRRFAETAIQALADSIKQNGVLQPILVRRHQSRPGEFEIVAGERRWRAAKLARVRDVPIVVCNVADRTTLEFALIENLHREDLTPLELAEGYRQLRQEFRHTQESLAKILGKSRSHIANTLRLLNLPPAVKEALQEGKLSAGHARVLLNTDRAEALARQIVDEGLSVRETECLAKNSGATENAERGAKPRRAWQTTIEPDLSRMLGHDVTVAYNGRQAKLTVHCTSQVELDDLVRRLKKALDCGRSDEMLAQPLAATDCGVAGNADGYVVSTNGTATTVYRILARQTARFRNEPHSGPSTVFDSLEEAKDNAVAIVDQAISNAERQNLSAVAQKLLRTRLETQTKDETSPWVPPLH